MAIDAISEAECQPDGDVGHESLKQDARQGDAREAVPDSKAELAVWAGLAEHISRVAGTHVRNAATVAGNLVLTRGHGLPSDVATLLLATDASVEVADAALGGLAPVSLPLEAFLATRMPHSDGRTASNGEREGAHKAVTLVSELPGATQLVTAVTVPVPEFILNGKSVPLDPSLATTSLAEYIRSQTHVKSVKISCGSGGCGACTVLLQQHDPATGRLLTRSVNACLTPAFMAVGAQVTSAEGLARDSQGQPVVA
ncbi:aldehyde oxidase/xanthine dehydrogenase, a/b hammerhead, partial [Haematococcus lacustris]